MTYLNKLVKSVYWPAAMSLSADFPRTIILFVTPGFKGSLEVIYLSSQSEMTIWIKRILEWKLTNNLTGFFWKIILKQKAYKEGSLRSNQ